MNFKDSFKGRDQKDFNAGLMFMAIGLIFAIGAFNYPMGSALRMGPAYFPSVLGWMLVILGAIVFLRSFFLHKEPPPRPTQWRGLLWILGSVMAFGWLVDPLQGGLIVASLAIMLMSAYGGWEFRWKEAVISAVFMTALCVGAFYYALGLPFRLWPWS